MRAPRWIWMMAAVGLWGCSDAIDEPIAIADAPGIEAPLGGKSDSFSGDTESVWATIRARCAPPGEDEQIVYSSDFQWGYSLDAMATRFEEIYESGKRLHERAAWDGENERFMMPATRTWGGAVELPPRLVENVTLHIEHGLERGYVDFVFFPDMGHSHLFIPQDSWDNQYAGMPVSEISRRYELLFDDPGLMVLYHTAEQLDMLTEDDQLVDDRHVQWRYHTRNLVGDNNHERRIELLFEPESNANTAHDLAGYRYYGAGFNVSASKDGCFPYEVDGETRWYDLSLSDLPYPDGG